MSSCRNISGERDNFAAIVQLKLIEFGTYLDGYLGAPRAFKGLMSGRRS